MSSELHRIQLPPVPRPTEGAARQAMAPRAGPATEPESESQRVDDRGLSQALEAIVERARTQGAALDFRIDDESGRLIVSLVDRRDGTVLRQMPSEEALRIARTLARERPHLIEVRA